MGLKQLLYTGVAAAYLTLAGCGASTQATTATTAEQVPQEASQERECPPQLLYLAIENGGVTAIFDSDGNDQPDYSEVRRMGPNGQLDQHPFIYGWDLNGDGAANAQTPGEILYDPAKDGLNGNEMTPGQFEQFQRGQREQPTSALESRLQNT